MRSLPKLPRDFQGVDPYVLPPSDFVTSLVQLSMMTAAERHGELITHLKTHRPRLRKTQVMWIGRLPAADEARL
jgi:hypothetical protein